MDHQDASYSHEATQTGGNDQYHYDHPAQQQFEPSQPAPPEPVPQPMPPPPQQQQQQQQPPSQAGVGYQFNMTYQNGGPGPNHHQPPNFPPQSPQAGGQHPPPKYANNGTQPAAGYNHNNSTANFPPAANAHGQHPPPIYQHPNQPYANGTQLPGYHNNSSGDPPVPNYPPLQNGFPVYNNNNQNLGPNFQPMMIQPQFVENWRTGLFDCMDDPMSAVVTAFCPCVTFGQVAEILDNGQTSCATSGMLFGLVWFFLGIPCVLSCTYRTKLRNKFGLVESPAPDWVTHFLCDCCAICQEYRELQLRGLDPSIGWQGNVAKVQAGFMQQQANMNAPPNQRMMP